MNQNEIETRLAKEVFGYSPTGSPYVWLDREGAKVNIDFCSWDKGPWLLTNLFRERKVIAEIRINPLSDKVLVTLREAALSERVVVPAVVGHSLPHAMALAALQLGPKPKVEFA